MNQPQDRRVLGGMAARSLPADHDFDDVNDGAGDGVDVDADADADVDVDGDVNDRLRVPLAAAFCRGRLGLGDDVDDAAALAAGRAAGLRLHRFKRAQPLPRVERVLSTLRGLGPADLLDIGTGRGAFLWPLLEAFPHLPVRCVDVRADRVVDLNAVAAPGSRPMPTPTRWSLSTTSATSSTSTTAAPSARC